MMNVVEDEDSNDSLLYECEPIYWKNRMNKTIRMTIGWLMLVLFQVFFISFIWLGVLAVLPFFYPTWTSILLSTFSITVLASSYLIPVKEWPWSRKLGQLWYEIFRFSCNLSEEQRNKILSDGWDGQKQFIIAMHPHGILPFHAIMWSAYCDQFLQKDEKSMYGFGAVADITLYLPILRNVLGWFTAGSADYKTIRNGLLNGICDSANAAGRKPKHLFILPGGVAEVFTCKPRSHTIVFKERRGLIKVAIETGAHICPTYVFGGNDFFENIMTNENFHDFANWCRRRRFCVGLFWGRFGLPIPFTPRLTMCVGDPIAPPTEWAGKAAGDPCPSELIEEMHASVTQEIRRVFDRYKAAAGYPEGQLQII